MTAAQKRKAVVDAYSLILGRNIYSQHAAKRECVFEKYSDGEYYSDCSSSVRRSYRKANVGFPNIGSSTIDQYSNKALKTVACAIKSGVPTDISALRVADLLLFAGSDTSRAYVDYVGHVEMIYKISGNTVTLCGHGSGKPRTINMATYCKTRQNTKTSTKKGNRGLLKVVRAIQDDDNTVVPADPMKTQPTLTKGIKITGASVNLRLGPGTEYGIVTQTSAGRMFENAMDAGWYPVVFDGRILWVAPTMATEVK